MALIVVESGGSKSNWWCQDKYGNRLHFKTVGLHPFENLADKFLTVKKKLITYEVDKTCAIYFYGAGCETREGKDKIVQMFIDFGFSSVIVKTDLLGACIACWQKSKGLTAILGTGAVAAEYDGHKIVRQASGLGYVLGDEGSGFDLGKRLLISYFKNELPPIISDDIEDHFGGKKAVLPTVYQNGGRKKVADLAPIIKKHEDHELIVILIHRAFNDFVLTALSPILPERDVACVGSIAFYFKDQLEKVLATEGYKLVKTLPDAHKELFNYHLKNSALDKIGGR